MAQDKLSLANVVDLIISYKDKEVEQILKELIQRRQGKEVRNLGT